ncbi:MAG TPA: hypothetical protein VGG19_08020 [Tepidisphaeraceae bacterium]
MSAASLYVVRTDHGINVLTKNSLSFTDTYVDIRKWKSDDLPDHRELVDRLIAKDRKDLLAEVPGVVEEAEKGKSSKHHKHSHHDDIAVDE